METEAIIRLSVFLGGFTLFATWEALAPRRARALPRLRRWATNWGLVLIDTALVRLAFPAAAVGAALDAEARGIGALNLIDLPLWLEVMIAVLILDLAIWAQHVATHMIPVLWRIHRVHHVDRDMDVTTAIRFHPVEILLSMGLKIGLVYLLGPAAVAVILFEVLLNACAMFSHANLTLPPRVDAVLRLLIVTPDMHRSHHSTDSRETDTNYGFFLSWWDRLFNLYTATPRAGHQRVEIGLSEHQTTAPARLGWTLIYPFRR